MASDKDVHDVNERHIVSEEYPYSSSHLPALQRNDAQPMPYDRMMSLVKKFFLYALPSLLLMELLIYKHAYFRLDKSMFFHAWYGLIACICVVALSKALGFALKRLPFYYDAS